MNIIYELSIDETQFIAHIKQSIEDAATLQQDIASNSTNANQTPIIKS